MARAIASDAEPARRATRRFDRVTVISLFGDPSLVFAPVSAIRFASYWPLVNSLEVADSHSLIERCFCITFDDVQQHLMVARQQDLTSKRKNAENHQADNHSYARGLHPTNRLGVIVIKPRSVFWGFPRCCNLGFGFTLIQED